jgi:hypothetical protein
MENERGWPVNVFDRIVRDYNLTDKYAVECLRRAWNVAAARIDAAVHAAQANQDSWKDDLWDAQVGLIYALDTAVAVGMGAGIEKTREFLEK